MTGILGLTNRKVPERRKPGWRWKERNRHTHLLENRNGPTATAADTLHFQTGWALTQRSDRLSATVFKRKPMITRPRTYLDLHHMPLGPAQMKSLYPKGLSQVKGVCLWEFFVFHAFLWSSIAISQRKFLCLPFSQWGRLAIQSLNRGTLTLPETGTGWDHSGTRACLWCLQLTSSLPLCSVLASFSLPPLKSKLYSIKSLVLSVSFWWF